MKLANTNMSIGPKTGETDNFQSFSILFTETEIIYFSAYLHALKEAKNQFSVVIYPLDE